MLASHLITPLPPRSRANFDGKICERAALAVNRPTYLAPDIDARRLAEWVDERLVYLCIGPYMRDGHSDASAACRFNVDD